MNKTFDVVGKKKYFYIFSIAVIVIAIILTFVMGMNIAIEFKGGTIITYSYSGTINENSVASTATSIVNQPCNATLGESLADGMKTVSLSFPSSKGLSA